MRVSQARGHVRRQVNDVGQLQKERPPRAHLGAQARQDRGDRIGGQSVLAQVLVASRQALPVPGRTGPRQHARRHGPAPGGDEHLGGGPHQGSHAKAPRQRVEVAEALQQVALVKAARAAHRHVASHDRLVGRPLAQARRHLTDRVSPLAPRHGTVAARQRVGHARAPRRLAHRGIHGLQRIGGAADARRDRPARPGLVDDGQGGHEGHRAGGGAEREGREEHGGGPLARGRGGDGLPRGSHLRDRVGARGLQGERAAEADHLSARTQPRGAARSGQQLGQ